MIKLTHGFVPDSSNFQSSMSEAVWPMRCLSKDINNPLKKLCAGDATPAPKWYPPCNILTRLYQSNSYLDSDQGQSGSGAIWIVYDP